MTNEQKLTIARMFGMSCSMQGEADREKLDILVNGFNTWCESEGLTKKEILEAMAQEFVEWVKLAGEFAAQKGVE
jgi:hypothetical protein